MSFNGSGTFQINTAGQPVVAGTVITATAFNALTADLATGLSTCVTKDGQTTVTANLPMGGNKLTGLGAGTLGTDSARLSQVQGGISSLLGVSGIDTITGSGSPQVTTYATGQMFWFVASGTNTGAATLNIDSLGAKSITRGTAALAAGDIISGSVALVVYDGTQFQLLSINRSIQVNGTIASATTTNIGAANAEYLAVSGTTTITAFDTVAAGIYRVLKFDGILTLTHNATSLILPGSASITTAANDVAGFRSLGSGNWRCEWYQRASGSALSTAASSITGQVSVANGGTGASTLTANNVILGNGTSAVQFVAPGTTGNILTSNGTTWTSTAPASSGKLVQQVISASSALASGAGTIPFDDTIPQNTEGNEFLTVSITPTSASNYLVIEVNALLSTSSGQSTIGAIFQDSTANALAATSNTPPATGSGQFFVLRHRMTAGTTSSTTFKFRAGAIAAATTYLNGNGSGTRLFGGVAASLITVTEIAP
jgi:hypothetical protein